MTTQFSVKRFEMERVGAGTELRVQVQPPQGEEQQLFFRADSPSMLWRPEALATALLLPAMALADELVLPGPLDPVFTRNLGRAQMLWQGWLPTLRPVVLRAAASSTASPADPWRREPASAAPRALSFFSGGVDSFYTLLDNVDEIRTLVFVMGFDLALEDQPRFQQALASVRKVAAAYGKLLVVVTTNLRFLFKEWIPPMMSLSAWELAHGAALACVSHLVAQGQDRALIPSGSTPVDMTPWGTHPSLEPLWSSGSLGIVNDGYWANRRQKVARLAQEPLALNNLRVCWQNTAKTTFNCGVCEKCIRTMLALLACDALDRCPTFERALDPAAVAAIPMHHDYIMAEHKALEEILRRRNIRPDIQRALRHAIRRSRRQHRIQLLRVALSGFTGGKS